MFYHRLLLKLAPHSLRIFAKFSAPKIVMVLCLAASVGCFRLPTLLDQKVALERPQSFEEYYEGDTTFESFEVATIKERDEYLVHQITLHTSAGAAQIDFYQNRTPSEDLIFVFPVLGGRPILSRYFADYLTKRGFDSAIVHRNNEFKDPDNVHILEELFRKGVVRDRRAIDFFEREHGKKNFGAFGISRGAINVAITAGIDPRLKYNVMVMGAADLPNIFRYSRERKIQRYMKKVTDRLHLTRDEFISHLEQEIKTDPKYVAQYIDPENTLLILSGCDTTVPFEYGLKLRELIGLPETIILFAGHRTGILFTQFVKLVLPFEEACFFPFDYVESEALAFFRRSFGRGSYPLRLVPFRVLQFPGNLMVYGLELLRQTLWEKQS